MKLLFIQSAAPHGSVNAQEGLDALLMGSAFSECAVLFSGDGVMQLVSGQDTSGLGTKDFARTFGALRDYGVSRIYCDQADLNRFGLSISDLTIEVSPLDSAGIRALLDEHDKVLSF